MKEIKSKKSIRKQMDKFIKLRLRYQKDIFIVLEDNPKSANIEEFCYKNNLNYERVCEVITYFKYDTESTVEVPVLLLSFIKDIGITTDEKMNAVLKDISKSNPELEEYNLSNYKNSVSLWINYLHRDEKKALRMARVTASINKKFYNYLVKRDYLVDYRNPDNWHSAKREAYYKKLELQKRESNEK